MQTSRFTTDRIYWAYPELWEWCEGAWFPGMGVQGLTLFDWSGYDQHMILANSVLTDWMFSGGADAVIFNGSNSYGNVTSPKVMSGENWSACGWVHLTSVGTQKSLFYLGGDTVTKDQRVEVTSSGKIVGISYNTSSSNQVTGSTTLSTNTWYHVAVTRSRSEMWVYVNGLPEATTAVTANLSLGAGSQKRMIASNGFSGYYLPGMLDDVRMYSRVITPGEVLALSTCRGYAYMTAFEQDLAAIAGSSARSRILTGGVMNNIGLMTGGRL